jgi:predicted DNA-binding protein
MTGRVTKILGVSLPPQLFREVEQTARRLHKTKSELFREAWEAYKNYLDEREFGRLGRVARRQARSRGYEIRSEEDVDRILHER